jgi:hypothetical protein
MKYIKSLKKWGIYENNDKEEKEYGFKYTVIHPDNMGVPGLTPKDSDWECATLEAAESWIKNY